MRGEEPLPNRGVRTASVAATALAIALASWLTIATSAPSLLSPYSLAVVIPYLWAGGPLPAVLIWPAFFAVPGAGLIAGRLRPPRGSGLLLALLAMLSLWFAAWGVRPGLRHYGGSHTFGILVADVLLIAALVLLLLRSLSRPSFGRLLAFHGLLWTWFAWIGLPWLRQVL